MKWKLIIFMVVIVIFSSLVSAKTIKDSRTDCENDVCTFTSNVRFGYEDNEWKPIKKMKSLKNTFDLKYLEVDPNFDFIINDYNHSWIDYCIETTYDKLNIPLKIVRSDGGIYSITYKLRKNTQLCDTFQIPVAWQDEFNIVDNLIHWGFNSTVVTLEADDGSFSWSSGRSCDIDAGGSDHTNILDPLVTCDSTDDNPEYISRLENSNNQYYEIGEGYGSTDDSAFFIGGFDTSASNSTIEEIYWDLEYYNYGAQMDSYPYLYNYTGSIYYKFNTTKLISADQHIYFNSTVFGLDPSQFMDSDGYTYFGLIDNDNTYAGRIIRTDYIKLVITYSEGAECTANWTNTSWSVWTNISCLSNDTMNESRNLTQYDLNECGDANITHYEYNTSKVCDYCSYNLTYTEWTNESCLPDDTMNQTRTKYDSNYSTCYAITSLVSDAWDGITDDNVTEYNTSLSCDYCIPSLTNTSWSAWINLSCLANDTMEEVRSLTQYDSNSCGEISNTTHYEYNTSKYCEYIPPPSANLTETLSIYPNIFLNNVVFLNIAPKNYTSPFVLLGERRVFK